MPPYQSYQIRFFYARSIASAHLFCFYSILSNREEEGNLPLESPKPTCPIFSFPYFGHFILKLPK